MTLSADNVRVALTGAAYLAPIGTALPEDIGASLDDAFVDLGYISDDGVTITPSIDSDEITAWQNADVVRRTLTRTHEIKFTAIETKKAVLEAAYESAGTATNNGVKYTLGSAPTKRAIVIDAVDGTGFVRHAAASVQLTDIGDIQYQNGDPVGYEMTFSVYKINGIDIVSYHAA